MKASIAANMGGKVTESMISLSFAPGGPIEYVVLPLTWENVNYANLVQVAEARFAFEEILKEDIASAINNYSAHANLVAADMVSLTLSHGDVVEQVAMTYILENVNYTELMENEASILSALKPVLAGHAGAHVTADFVTLQFEDMGMIKSAVLNATVLGTNVSAKIHPLPSAFTSARTIRVALLAVGLQAARADITAAIGSVLGNGTAGLRNAVPGNPVLEAAALHLIEIRGIEYKYLVVNNSVRLAV
jgi:hypothetical protein